MSIPTGEKKCCEEKITAYCERMNLTDEDRGYFINLFRSTHSSLLKELEGEIENLRKPKRYWSHPWWDKEEIAYNEAVDDVINLLHSHRQ